MLNNKVFLLLYIQKFNIYYFYYDYLCFVKILNYNKLYFIHSRQPMKKIPNVLLFFYHKGTFFLKKKHILTLNK